MKPLILFGNTLIAELAHFYFTRDSEHKVHAFCVDASHLKDDHFMGLPLVAFEEIEHLFPPSDYDMFIAIGYSDMNRLRRRKYLEAKGKGYRLVNYISSKAIMFAASIGDNCFIPEANIVQPYARIGNNVLMIMNNGVGHHSTIGDHCMLSSHTIVGGIVQMGEGCFIGMNATLRDGISLAPYTLVGAGALILESSQPETTYKGAQASLLPKRSFDVKL